MKRYIKDNIIKPQNRIIVIKDDLQYINPSEEMILEDGWVEYEIKYTDEELIDRAKNKKIQEILDYDTSSDVNCFYMSDVEIWLDKETRTGLKLRFEAEINVGIIETSLWYNNIKFTLPTESAVRMLYLLEIYASQCYDNTQFHIKSVSELTNIDDIEKYDYKTGYPGKLKF